MRSSRFSLLLALSLAVGMFVGAISTGGAQGNYAIPYGDDVPGAYFPWIPNGSELDGMGPFYGTLTVQNLSSEPADIYLFPGHGSPENAWGIPTALGNMPPNASATVTAGALDIPAPGGSVRAHAIPVEYSYDFERGGFFNDEDESLSPDDYGRVAGAVKNVSSAPGTNANTSAANITLDGYGGLTTDHLTSKPTGAYRYVVPIVQANDGWNTVLRIANFGPERMSSASSVYNINVYEAGGPGSAEDPVGQYIGDVRSGEVESVDLIADIGLEPGFVGNAFLTSNQPLGVVAERYKVGNQMLLTNVARGEAMDTDTHIAPLVFRNYNNWNSGISVTNLSEIEDTTVTVTYISSEGEAATSDEISIARRGMAYVYHPGTGDGAGTTFVGAAIIQSSNGAPIQAVVDQVKYFGDADDVGDAMSYVTDPQVAGNQAPAAGNRLSLPLMQRGTPDGLGDNSGVQLFNPVAGSSVQISVQIFDQSGAEVVLDGPIAQTLAGRQSLIVYAPDIDELPQRFQGSLVVTVTGGDGLLTAVSNNVNYAVQADGGSVFSMPVID